MPSRSRRKTGIPGDLTASALSYHRPEAVYMVWVCHLAGRENKGPDQSNYISQGTKTKPLKLLVSILALSLSWPLMLLRLINSDVKPGAGVLVILIAVRSFLESPGMWRQGSCSHICPVSPGRGD